MENLIVLIIAVIGIIVKAKSSDEKKKKQNTYPRPQQPRQQQPKYVQQPRPQQSRYVQQPRPQQSRYVQQPRPQQPMKTVQPKKEQLERYEQWKAVKESTQGKALDAMKQVKRQEQHKQQENAILERANQNLQEYEGDVESDMLSQVTDRIVTGYAGDMKFDRDFIAEGVEMLNSFQIPDSVEQFLMLPEQ